MSEEPTDPQAAAEGEPTPEQPPQDDTQQATEQVDASEPAPGNAVDAEPAAIDLPSFDGVEVDEPTPASIELLSDVNLNVRIELGRTRMLVEDVLRLREGGVVELEKLAGDPVDIYVNDRLVARGEVLVLNDNFCVRVSEILDTERVGQRSA